MVEKSSQSDLSQTKLLEAAKSTRKLLNRLNSPRLSAREMAETMTLIARETSVLKAWIHALSQISFHGARAFAKASPTAAADVGLDSFGLAGVTDENDRRPYEIFRVRQKFIDDCHVQFHLKMSSLDQLSQLGSMTFADDRDSEVWAAVSSECWTSWGRRGAIGVVTGGIKTGKTNLSLLLAEYFMAKGHIVVSNIAVADPTQEYIYAAKLSDMLINVCEARLKGKEVLLVMDEGALYWNRIETIQKTNVNLSKLLMAIGKLHVVLCFICHEEQQVPGVIARNAIATFSKRGLREAFVEVIDSPLKVRARLLTNVPSCKSKYDPDQLQFWQTDMSVPELFNFMSNLPQGGNQWQLTLDYVKAHKGEADEIAVSPREVVQFLRRRGLSEKKISDAVGKAPSTVHLWVSAEK